MSPKEGPKEGWLGAAEAAQMLDVSRATLYAYVSRGFVRSRATAAAATKAATRERRYSREDVERLRRRTEERRDPDKAAARALQWGMPILESSITLIDAGKIYYRGHDAVTLSRTRSIAEIASLVWGGNFEASLAAPPAPRRVAADAPFVSRAQAALAEASTGDPASFDLQPAGVMRTGWRILNILTRTAAGAAAKEATIDATLAHAWGVKARGVDVIRAALILCADHELNVSSFTARCVASAGSHPYAVVMAGLAALEGTKHGGASARAESQLAALRRTRDPREALAARLRRGETLDGFGHQLYPAGDPRADALLAALRERYPRSADLAFMLEFAGAASAAVGDHPNLDFGLAAVSRVLKLPPGSALTLFAIGRTIGWIGHALEQYATGQLIRTRARYSGVPPLPARA